MAAEWSVRETVALIGLCGAADVHSQLDGTSRNKC